ncbi:hypothetical protein [Nocardia alni]|uniref:hypothetical protein n=1 Tax=Nocardia alni TaxID=2815723 RepID=UPI001C246F4B|nr:hypothetical protein [Nocardia alni]
MEEFDIIFTGERAKDDPLVSIGMMKLGADTEYFHAPTTYWSTDQYESSWNTALRRICDGAEVSCLVVAIEDPEAAAYIEVWPLYREDDTVHFQNHLIFMEQLDHKFNPNAPWDSVHSRETVNEDGNSVSEWTLPLQSVKNFLTQKPGRQEQ